MITEYEWKWIKCNMIKPDEKKTKLNCEYLRVTDYNMEIVNDSIKFADKTHNVFLSIW